MAIRPNNHQEKPTIPKSKQPQSANASSNLSIDNNYISCTTRADVNLLTSHLRQIIEKSAKPFIFLDCEGRELGSRNGKLSLIQIGIGDSIYLVDVIVLSEAATMLKEYLEDPNLVKYVWDGRSDYSELRHGHGVTLKGLIDLQLVYLYSTGEAFVSGRAIRLSSMMDAAEKLNALTMLELSRVRSGYYIATISHLMLGQAEVKEAHRSKNSEIWLSRPLPGSLRDYASYDVLVLNRLLKKLNRHIGHRATRIQDESRRYAELHHNSRSNRDSKWHNHGFLPQEILERTSTETDRFGTKTCPGCSRVLHQSSFYSKFRIWDRKPFAQQLCFTCFSVQQQNNGRDRRTSRQIEEANDALLEEIMNPEWDWENQRREQANDALLQEIMENMNSPWDWEDQYIDDFDDWDDHGGNDYEDWTGNSSD